jgi:mediator of RNA polymerase II transcription subunit 31
MADKPISARFTLELEFVLCLANPDYLGHLAHAFPHLLVSPEGTAASTETDATRFVRYLEYLYDYWRKPEYSQYLTHPGTTLRNLELLQQEQFRKDLINIHFRQALIDRLAVFDPPPGLPANDGAVEGQEGQPQAVNQDVFTVETVAVQA